MPKVCRSFPNATLEFIYDVKAAYENTNFNYDAFKCQCLCESETFN